MKELPILQKNRGINAAIDPRQFVWTENGFEFLRAAVNVDITDGYRISRRKGFEYKVLGDAHSIFHDGLYGYCVYEDNLVRLADNLSMLTVRTDIGVSKVRYAGAGDKVFYSNGTVNGFIHNALDYAWAPGTYAGPDTVHEYVAPPVCKHLKLHRGRMYLSVGPTLWYTEPLYYLGLNKAENFISFGSDIRMILSVGRTLFVADQTTVHAFIGSSPDDFESIPVLNDYVIEDTALTAYSPMILGKVVPGPVGLFTTQNAIYAATADGSVSDVTENRLRLPYANSGNAYLVENVYTVLIDE